MIYTLQIQLRLKKSTIIVERNKNSIFYFNLLVDNDWCIFSISNNDNVFFSKNISFQFYLLMFTLRIHSIIIKWVSWV